MAASMHMYCGVVVGLPSLPLSYTHYDDYRPPITGHFRDYRLIADFLMATSRLLKMINGHLE